MDHNECTDRMQLVVAAMIKDYEKARNLANAILKIHPDDPTVQKFSSMLEKEMNKRKKIQEDDSEDGSTETDDDDDNNSEDSLSKSDTDCSTESNSDTEETIIISSDSMNLGDCKTNSKINQETTENKHLGTKSKRSVNNFELEGKIIRVLPVKLSPVVRYNKANQRDASINNTR